MLNIPKEFYKKKYVFDVAYFECVNDVIITRTHEQVSVCADHSKYAFAKCATHLFKSHPRIIEIISIELLYSEPNN